MSIQKIVLKAINGDKIAKIELIKHYTNLVTNYVDTRYKDSNYDKDMLIKAGINGFLKGLDNWKKSDNISISAYISNNIKSGIRTEINSQEDRSKIYIQKLVDKMLNGDELAKNKLVKHYTDLIIKFVKNNYPNNLYNQQDLIQAGCVGLIKAINNYKENLESVFPRYVKTAIHREINKELDKEKENSFIDYIGLNKNTNIIDKFSDNEAIIAINSIIENMPQRTKEILYLYFYKEYSFVDIGKKYNLTKQRIEKICKENIEIIKNELIENKEKIKKQR